MTALGSRAIALATSAPPLEIGAPLDAVLRLERAVLETSVVVPVLRAPEVYALGERVEAWDGRAVSRTGAWNLASPLDQGRGAGRARETLDTCRFATASSRWSVRPWR